MKSTRLIFSALVGLVLLAAACSPLATPRCYNRYGTSRHCSNGYGSSCRCTCDWRDSGQSWTERHTRLLPGR